MKRIFALLLCVILSVSVFASCEKAEGGTAGQTDAPTDSGESTPAVTSELIGVWYGPANQPELDIKGDGTGTYKYLGGEGDAAFKADGKLFTAESDDYLLTGEYTLEGDTLTVKGEGYDTVLTRAKKTVDEELVGTWYFGKEDNITEIDYGPDGKGEIIIPGTLPEIFYYSVCENVITYVHVNGGPPEEGEYTTGTTPKITPPNAPDTTVTMWNGGSIVGTWLDPEIAGTYTFNADGTGSLTALGGLVTGTISYSYEANILTMTVSADFLGDNDTESGSGYVYIEGDTLYSVRGNGDPLALTRYTGE